MFLRWVSQKMDGVRGYWGGTKIVSRNGNNIALPPNFTLGFSSVPLNGELWMERGTFELLMSHLSLKEFNNPLWRKIGYYIFDIPYSSFPYKERLNQLKQLEFPSHMHLVESIECRGSKYLNLFLTIFFEFYGFDWKCPYYSSS